MIKKLGKHRIDRSRYASVSRFDGSLFEIVDLTREAASGPIPIERFILAGNFDDDEALIGRDLPHQTFIWKLHQLLTEYSLEFVYLGRNVW